MSAVSTFSMSGCRSRWGSSASGASAAEVAAGRARPRRAVAIAAVLGSALALAACGGNDDPQGAAGAGASSSPSRSTSPSPSPSVEAVGSTVSMKALGARMNAAMDDVTSFTGTLDGSAGVGAGDASGTIKVKKGAKGITGEERLDMGGKKKLRVIFSPSAVYVDVRSIVKGSPKPWFKARSGGKDQLSKSLQPLFDLFQQQGDPASQLKMYASAGSATVKGHRTVDGEPVTDYVMSGKVSKAQASSWIPEGSSSQVRKAIVGATYEVTMAVSDESDRPVSVESHVKLRGMPETATTLTYSDWNEPVTITVPKASDVLDAGAFG